MQGAAERSACRLSVMAKRCQSDYIGCGIGNLDPSSEGGHRQSGPAGLGLEPYALTFKPCLEAGVSDEMAGKRESEHTKGLTTTQTDAEADERKQQHRAKT